ncbi:MAG: MoaD/ThiS family protein, partial [Chloroflexota bacterium]
MVRLVLHGELRRYAPGKFLEVEGEGRTPVEILAALGVPASETAAFIVNGEQREADTALRDGDTLEVL